MIAALRWLVDKLKSSKRKVTVEFSQEEYALLEQAAKAVEIPVKAFVAGAARSRASAVERAVGSILADNDRRAPALEAAYDALDEEERGIPNPPAPTPLSPPVLPPSRGLEADVPAAVTEQMKVAAKEATPTADPITGARHPCRFFSARIPVQYQAGDCQGSCLKQHGRPCFWAPATAKRCPIFDGYIKG